MGNPYGGPKPFKLRNPKTVTLFNTKNGKYTVKYCYKSDILKNEKGQITDYTCTAKEHGDWFTVSVFPARSWCSKEEWEKRSHPPREKAAPVEMEAEPPEAAPVTVDPPTDLPAPLAAPTAPPPPSGKKLTFTVLDANNVAVHEEDNEDITPAELAALSKPRVGPVSLDVELPGEYNPRAHLNEKLAEKLTPEDLVKLKAHVETNWVEDEAKRKIAQMRHRTQMERDLLAEKAGFMP